MLANHSTGRAATTPEFLDCLRMVDADAPALLSEIVLTLFAKAQFGQASTRGKLLLILSLRENAKDRRREPFFRIAVSSSGMMKTRPGTTAA
jgi:hypothetical protein